MTKLSYRSTRACQWVEPRPVQDASMRLRTHGPIRPMQEPSPFRTWHCVIAAGALIFIVAGVFV